MAQPTPENYSCLCQWMDDNGVKYVQGPFEADPQMKQLIEEGKATAAITEDGDLVVYEVPRVMSITKLDAKEPSKSTCQLFVLDKLKRGEYNSAIAAGQRSNYLAEISCFLGNDFMDRMPNAGAATVFATGKHASKENAVIDLFI